MNTFIDIGSGYGKVVFHAKLGGKYSHSVGIEYVKSRASLAGSIRDELLLERNNLLGPSARELLRSCVLVHQMLQNGNVSIILIFICMIVCSTKRH